MALKYVFNSRTFVLSLKSPPSSFLLKIDFLVSQYPEEYHCFSGLHRYFPRYLKWRSWWTFLRATTSSYFKFFVRLLPFTTICYQRRVKCFILVNWLTTPVQLIHWKFLEEESAILKSVNAIVITLAPASLISQASFLPIRSQHAFLLRF